MFFLFCDSVLCRCCSAVDAQPSGGNRRTTCRYSGGGFVKKSFPFPKLSLQRRRRLMALGSSRERMLRKHKKRADKPGTEGSTKSQGIREARYRKARKLLKNAIAKVN